MSPVLARIARIIDEEIERDAEYEYTRPLDLNQLTAYTKGLKDVGE